MQVTVPTDLPTCQGVRDPGPSSMAPARLQLAADSIEPPCPMHSITCHFCSLLHRGCSCPGSGSHSVFPGWVGGADPRFWGCGRPPRPSPGHGSQSPWLRRPKVRVMCNLSFQATHGGASIHAKPSCFQGLVQSSCLGPQGHMHSPCASLSA